MIPVFDPPSPTTRCGGLWGQVRCKQIQYTLHCMAPQGSQWSYSRGTNHSGSRFACFFLLYFPESHASPLRECYPTTHCCHHMVYLYLDVLDWLNGALFGIVPPQACLVFKAKTTGQHILFLKSLAHLTASVTQNGVADPWALPYITKVLTLLCLQSGFRFSVCSGCVFTLSFGNLNLTLQNYSWSSTDDSCFHLSLVKYSFHSWNTYVRQNLSLKTTKRKKHPYSKLKYYRFYILEHIISLLKC